MNKVHTKHYRTDRRNSSYQTLLLSLHLTQTLQESHEKRISMEELKFFQDMKMWSGIGSSPSKALCQTCPLHSTPASPGSAGREHFQFLLPTFPAATAHKTLVANVLSALCVHRVKQTSWKSPFSIILCVIFLFYSPACDFSTRGRGRTSVSLSYCLCRSQCTPEFQLSCSISRWSCQAPCPRQQDCPRAVDAGEAQ